MANQPLFVITDDYPEPGLLPSLPDRPPLPGRHWRRSWLTGFLFLAFLLWLVSLCIPFLIQHTALQKRLTAHLAAAFGRPVQVYRYNFSLWTGPALEAQAVTVGEDPRFGQEYFLRAEALHVRLRWGSLLRGHIELGTLLLSQPSLNVVSNGAGDWNLAEWLPRPALRVTEGTTPSSALPFQRVEVDGGRVNFKQRDVKLPFALVNVSGTVQSDGPGRWRMDIDATPWRAAVVTQQAGSIHISGHVGGTSSRLLPAVLDASWSDASISDALRLIRGGDYGVRGALRMVLSARANDDGWKLQGRAEMRQIHRWDLPLRPDDPALNLTAQMKVGANGSALDVTEALLEAPHSNARASAHFSWSGTSSPANPAASPFTAEVSDLNLDANDVLAWVRAFRVGIADDISLRGAATASAVAVGWPPHLDSAHVSTRGADLLGPRLRASVHLAAADLRYDRGQLVLSPVILAFDLARKVSVGSFRFEQSTAPRSRVSGWRLSGNLDQVRDLTAAAGSLGWNLSQGWDLAGALRCDLRWQGPPVSWRTESSGFLELGGSDPLEAASLRSGFLNRPVEGIALRADWKPGARRVTLSSAQAFGARWTGTLNRRDTDDQWQFALSADRLAASDVDLWLNPRWRESFIDRVLPFLSSRAGAGAIPENLRASGKLSVDQFALAPVTLRRLQGLLAVRGRHVELTGAAAQFYGGNVSGMFIAEFKPVPAYQVNADFARVDLSALSAASPAFAGQFAGTATGQLFVTAHGASRSDLVSSLQCRGSADVDNPHLQQIDLLASLRQVSLQTGDSAFREASAAFTCAAGRIQFHDFALIGAQQEIDGAGSVDSGRTLNFQLNLLRNPDAAAASLAAGASLPHTDSYQVSGPLSYPQFARASPLRRAR